MSDEAKVLIRGKLADWLRERREEIRADLEHAVRSTSFASAGVLDARLTQIDEVFSHMVAGDFDA